MSWWDGIWLNEGFVRNVQHIGTDHVQPGWMMVYINYKSIINLVKLSFSPFHHSLFLTLSPSLSLSLQLEQFFIDTVQLAFDADGLNWSHPIIQQANNPGEISALFDSISYNKVGVTIN